jgi:hypothetical protein
VGRARFGRQPQGGHPHPHAKQPARPPGLEGFGGPQAPKEPAHRRGLAGPVPQLRGHAEAQPKIQPPSRTMPKTRKFIQDKATPGTAGRQSLRSRLKTHGGSTPLKPAKPRPVPAQVALPLGLQQVNLLIVRRRAHGA